MVKIQWDAIGSHLYEDGVDRGAFFPENGPGVAWNGLISVTEAPSFEDPQYLYVDGVPIDRRTDVGSFAAKIEAFTYPIEFSKYDGIEDDLVSGQERPTFGLSYRTGLGNDLEGLDLGYKIHIVYNALAEPSDVDYISVGDSDDLVTFSWDITTTPIAIDGVQSAHLIIDTTKTYPETIAILEDILYGSDGVEPRLPTPEEVLDIFQENSMLKITDNGDGTFTAEGPDHIVEMLDGTTFQIHSPSAVYIDGSMYKVSSL